MVLWEITAATAYFLGLKRTYKIALKIQRRLVGPNHPKIREFLHRRTRSVFDMAVKVHKNIQERDIEVGRNLGNWMLRWLDCMKPSAQIRPRLPACSNNSPKHITSSGMSLGTQRTNIKSRDNESNGRQFFSPLNIHLKSIPTISMVLQPKKPAGMSGQHSLQVVSLAQHFSEVYAALDQTILLFSWLIYSRLIDRKVLEDGLSL